MEAPRGVAGEEGRLLTRAAGGDQRAATVLYDTYAPALYRYGLARLRDAELAEELVQRVLETVWRRAAAYDATRGPVAAFVFAIAASSVADLRRRAARRPRPVGTASEDAADDADDAAERVLVTATVRAALDRLTAEHRQVLELAYLRGLTQREIAELLHLPVGTVKSRTYYALRSLRLACEELGVVG